MNVSQRKRVWHPRCRKSARRHAHAWLQRYTNVSGFKWRETSPCHGSMMDHYGWVTSTGKSHKAHLTEGPEGGRTGFKERWEPYNPTPRHLFPHLYLLPLIPTCLAFHHSFVLLSPLLLAPLPSLSWLEGFHAETIPFLRCFPFSIIPASSSKGGLGGRWFLKQGAQNT